MSIIFDRIKKFKDRVSIRYKKQHITYAEIGTGAAIWLDKFPVMGIKPGEVVSIVARFSPASIILLIALVENKNIVVPLDDETNKDIAKRNHLACVSHYFRRSPDDIFFHKKLNANNSHPYLDRLQAQKKAGVIFFTSGSTGESKAAVHMFDRLISKHVTSKNKKSYSTMVFLKFDHIGGLNTLFSVLMNGGSMISVEDRNPEEVCRLIEEARIELFPTTPSFLNMLILSKAWKKYDLSSLKLITYGTEPMPDTTLRSMVKLFPNTKLKQTYGLTELGIFSTRSRSNRSTFIEIHEGDVRIKIENDVLFIKSDTAMLGYLNAAAPFDKDGWYNTGDKVIVEDGYTKILGRDSEIINVGGEKVFPSEIESVLLGMDNVKDVLVVGKRNPIIGQIVMAQFRLKRKEKLSSLRKRVWDYCQWYLEPHKIPRHIIITDDDLISNRLKKNRRNIQEKI